MNLGFSYVGLLYLVLLFLPNLLWAKNRPEDDERYAARENRTLRLLERTGQVLVTAFVLIFSDFNLRAPSPWSVWLLLSFLCMLLYEAFWVRYFRGGRIRRELYGDFMRIPVAGATLPVAAFLLLAVYGRNPLLLAAGLLLGIGHVGIHLGHRRELEVGPRRQERENADSRSKTHEKSEKQERRS